MKRIILCADDYGQNTVISQAIIDLLNKNRLSATSCMTNAPDWLSQARELKPLSHAVDIGLHFNLTEGKPLSSDIPFFSLNQLILRAFLRGIKPATVEAEFNQQLDQFVSGVGREPDFIDGHQHIHQLPIVRDAILNVYKKRLQKTGCYIRSVYRPIMIDGFKGRAALKKTIIQLCGARPFQRQLIANHIPHNTTFSGIYDFSEAQSYPTFFPRFLADMRQQGMIMCHPGLDGSADEDVIAHARFYEYQYFSSDQFVRDCESQHIQIGRFNS